MKKIRNNQRGETIVEVLISIAVVSLILTASYALANRSTQATRQSQERSEALKFAEEQLELIKAYLALNGVSSVPNTGFCVKYDSSQPPASQWSLVPTGSPPPADCTKGPDSRYVMTIIKNADDYKITSEWDKVGGNGKDRFELVYRIPSTTLDQYNF